MIKRFCASAIAVATASCVTITEYFYYYYYEVQPPQQSSGMQGRPDGSTLHLFFEDSRNRLLMNVDYKPGLSNLITPSSHLTGNPGFDKAFIFRDEFDLRFWAAFSCEARRWSFRPGRIKVFDKTYGIRRRVQLKQFALHVPAVMNANLLDEADLVLRLKDDVVLECEPHGMKAFSASLTVNLSVTELEISCDECLSDADGQNIPIPDTHLLLRTGRQPMGKREILLLPVLI